MEVNKKIISAYQKQLSLIEQEAQRLSKMSTLYSVLRLVSFVVAVVIVILLSSIGVLPVLIGSIASVGVFLFLVKSHQAQDRARTLNSIKGDIIKNEIQAITDRRNQNYNGGKYNKQEHYYSMDLDIFGPFSLFGLINRCRTYEGNKMLASILSTKPTLLDINYRQSLVKDLEREDEWKWSFLTSLFAIENGHETDIALLVNKTIERDLSFATKRWLSIYRRALPLIWIALLLLYFFATNWAILLAIIIGLANFRITMMHATVVSEIQFRLSKAGLYLEKYVSALSLIYAKNWTVDIEKENTDITDSIPRGDKIASLSTLKKLADLLDYRLHMIPSFILNVGFLWDSHIVSRLAAWRDRNMDLIDGVFELIGRAEAMTSLAIWSTNHPHFNYAQIDEQYFRFEGTQMRHPLLSYDECVPNDFTISPLDLINIVTGSNMSGKSTFLRTLGLNIILGYAGARVAADRLECGLVTVITYMRIKDALEENVSTFKAELDRIEQMLTLMQQKEPTLILADEMLRGTNSLDKLKGSKAILLKIMSYQCYAVIATHDIGLTDLGNSHPGSVNNYYFDINYEKGTLQFDYKIKPGICQNFNASFLLAKLGIIVDDNNYSKK